MKKILLTILWMIFGGLVGFFSDYISKNFNNLSSYLLIGFTTPQFTSIRTIFTILTIVLILFTLFYGIRYLRIHREMTDVHEELAESDYCTLQHNFTMSFSMVTISILLVISLMLFSAAAHDIRIFLESLVLIVLLVMHRRFLKQMIMDKGIAFPNKISYKSIKENIFQLDEAEMEKEYKSSYDTIMFLCYYVFPAIYFIFFFIFVITQHFDLLAFLITLFIHLVILIFSLVNDLKFYK
ncbi:MAG: DUF3169 family protein [Streptococcus sp.]|nr:DUF3169 family protein [Streptococcus sp.]